VPRTLDNDSTAGRIRAYFQRNPDDGLTVRDAAVKFGVPTQTAKSALRVERENGRLVRVPQGWYELPGGRP
jgi:Fic family protein